MAETCNDIEYILREWAPVSDLLTKIPTKTQNGLFNHDVSLTCLDILPEFIAVGTNLGLVYWYDRKKKDLQRLRCENQNSRITTIKVISTVDYMLACGNFEGQITIFQIPKSHPDTLPECLKPKLKQVERYTVTELHVSPITSLEWSKNGMILFSGDKNGLVVITEIDFYMHLSKSLDILNEAYEIVQLSYFQQQLLVSTTYRSIVCIKEEKWRVCQIGKKDRKALGKLGAVFWRNSINPKDLQIYCTRPGLRIWISDIEGNVQQTLLFKDLLNKDCFEVPLINPITGYAKKLKPLKEATFGVLLPFGDNLLVTYSSEVIYILDPINLLVIATISHLRRILSVAAYKDEIFILEGERSLIRIGFKPETIQNEFTSNTIPQASTFLPLTNSIKDLTSKIQTSGIISALPPLFGQPTPNTEFTDSTSVINAEEAIELPLPPVKKFPGHHIPLKISKSQQNTPQHIKTGQECKVVAEKKWQQFDNISAEQFDDHILFKHRRRRKKNAAQTTTSSMTSSLTSLSSTSSEERDGQINRPCVLNISTIGTLLPDLRSPDSILHDIESKEKLLADLLKLETIKFSNFENDTKDNAKTTLIAPTNYPTTISNKIIPSTANGSKTHLSNLNSSKTMTSSSKTSFSNVPQMKPIKNNIENPSTSYYFQQNNGSGVEKLKKSPEISYGPPSGSSNPNSIDPPACLAVPNVWKLQQISIQDDSYDTNPDNSLGDWVIL